MEIDVGFCGDAADFFEGLDGAEFVVGVHHGDEDGFWADGGADCIWIDAAFAIDWEVGDGNALLF